MHMVWHTAYTIGLAVEVLGDAVDIGIEVTLMVGEYGRFTTICAKNNVVVRSGVALDIITRICK